MPSTDTMVLLGSSSVALVMAWTTASVPARGQGVLVWGTGLVDVLGELLRKAARHQSAKEVCAILSRHSFFGKLRTPGGRCRSMRGRRNQSFQARALCWALGAVRISSRDWVRIWRIRPLRNCGGDWKKIAFSCKVARRSRSSSEASAALWCAVAA